MSSTLKLNQDYVNNTLIPNYAAVAFQTELGGNSAYLSKFSYAGGASTYSFGMFQYDVGSPSSTAARSFLTSIGFSAAQISQLSQQGGLSTTALSALNSQLNTALQNPANQAALDQLNINWCKGLVNQLQSALDVVYQKNPAVALQIYGSQELQLRLMDYANQFYLSSAGKMTDWLSGQSVTMASGSTLSLAGGSSLSGTLIDNFIMNTQQGVTNLNGNVTTRLNALDAIAPARSNASLSPVVDANGIVTEITSGTASTSVPGSTSGPGLAFKEVIIGTETIRIYDNGVIYSVDSATGMQSWNVPDASTGGSVQTTQFANGQLIVERYDTELKGSASHYFRSHHAASTTH